MQRITGADAKKIGATTAAVTALAVAGYGIWAYMKQQNTAADDTKPETLTAGDKMSPEEAIKHFFVDTAPADDLKTLYRTEAMKRSEQVKDVSYRLAYALNRGGGTFQGQVEVTFSLAE
jgi:hypothetical protein